MTRSSEANLRHPRHWPSAFGIGLFYLLVRIAPWPVLRALAVALGTFCYSIVPVRRHVALVNLRLAFPEKTAAERRALARAHYRSLALGLFETCAAWWLPAHRLPRHRIIGREHLEAACAGGRGAIVLTAHFTTLEICGRLLTDTRPFGCLYREPNNPIIAAHMRRQRERRMSIAVHFDDLRGLLRALRDGHAIWYAPDQSKRTKLSEILPFFGEPAITNTATSRIAQMSGAAVVPYFGRRLPDGSYELEILPALDHFPSGDHQADALRINRLIETAIRRAPEQYFWVHRRYKARGEGYPEVY